MQGWEVSKDSQQQMGILHDVPAQHHHSGEVKPNSECKGESDTVMEKQVTLSRCFIRKDVNSLWLSKHLRLAWLLTALGVAAIWELGG